VSTTNKILLAGAILVLFNLLLVIVFGDNGLVDYHLMRTERQRLVEKNAQLQAGNIDLSRKIDRLKRDPAFIERVARQDLGMIRPDEVIIKVDPAGGTGAGAVSESGSRLPADAKRKPADVSASGGR
jgi:cell division protein FtsB